VHSHWWLDVLRSSVNSVLIGLSNLIVAENTIHGISLEAVMQRNGVEMFNTSIRKVVFSAIAITLVSACSTNDLRQYQFNGTPLVSESTLNSPGRIRYGGSAGNQGAGEEGIMDVVGAISVFTVLVVIPWVVIYKAID